MTKGIGIFPFINSYRHDHIPAYFHQLSQKTALHRGKSGKSIQDYYAFSQNLRFTGHSGQYIQKLFLSDKLFSEIILEALVQKSNIRQFIIQIRILP